MQVKRRLHVRKIYFSLRREKVEFRGAIVGMKGLDKDIGPWATHKDVKEPDDR